MTVVVGGDGDAKELKDDLHGLEIIELRPIPGNFRLRRGRGQCHPNPSVSPGLSYAPFHKRRMLNI